MRLVTAPLAVEPVGLDIVLPLRRSLLYPTQRLEEAVFAGDHDSSSLHLAVFDTESGSTGDRKPIGTASLVHETPPWDSGRADGWRLRGICTVPERRKQGVASALVKAMLHHVAENGGGLVWSGTLLSGVSVFDSCGFSRLGPPFYMPDVGQHQTVWTIVDSESQTGS